MTETRPEAGAAALPAASGSTALVPESPGLAGWVLTSDHKRVGRLYIGFSLLFLLGALVIGALLGWERVDASDTQLLDDGAIAQFVSLHTLGLAFLGTTPLLLGLAIAVVPLQVGARSIAFPRAAAASFWLWLVGSLVFIGAIAADGGPGGGDPDSVELFLLAFGVLVLGLLLGSICVGTTVLTLRAPGMDLERVPFFAWGSLVGGVALLLTLPALIADLVLLYADNRYQAGFYGGSQGVSGYLAWTTRQPQVYAYALPALGLLADVVPVFARSRQRMVPVLLSAIGLGGFVALGAWAQSIYDLDLVEGIPYVAISLLAIVPVLLVLGVSGQTLAKGNLRMAAPLVGALTAGLVLLAGAAAGGVGSIPALETYGTAWDDGQFLLVVLGGAVAGVAGLVYWGPKLWGRLVPDGSAKGLLTLLALGALLAGLPLLVAGLLDQPAAAVNFVEEDASGALNALSAAGLSLMALLVLGAALLLLRAFSSGSRAGDDPWEGHTLEWATTSPPSPVNFPEPIPLVTSDRPLLDRRAAADGEVAR